MEDMSEVKKRIPKKYRKYFCTICKIYANSDNQLNQHLEGVRHQQRKLICLTPCTSEEYQYEPRIYIPVFIVTCVTIYIFCYTIVKLNNLYE